MLSSIYDSAAGPRNSSYPQAPGDVRNVAGELLLMLAAGAPRYQLTAEQIEYLAPGFPQAGRGEFSSNEEAAKSWRKFVR